MILSCKKGTRGYEPNNRNIHSMEFLLSLPANAVSSFDVLNAGRGGTFYADSDPAGTKVGSGGGTAWLLARHFQKSGYEKFDHYLAAGNRTIVHAGGQSRRLPAYAPAGKVFAPIPVFRWSRGQRLDQTLLELQMPLFHRIMQQLPGSGHTLVASGDVLLQCNKIPAVIPQTDVLLVGVWVDPHLASRHGVFFTPGNDPSQLEFMLQKPSRSKIEELAGNHLFMMDVGIWILRPKAVKALMKKCGWNGHRFRDEVPAFYDLYSTFGAALGNNPENRDASISDLSVAVVALEEGTFYHYGTSEELISSTRDIQNAVRDPRVIWHNRVKPHPSIFVQNAFTDIRWQDYHHHIWIENAFVPGSWKLTDHHVITGMPYNYWVLDLPRGICIDVVPVGDDLFCLRPYRIHDLFSGNAGDEQTLWMGIPLRNWMENHNLTLHESGIDELTDIHECPLFPLLKREDLDEKIVEWMFPKAIDDSRSRTLWLDSPRLSASELSHRANLERLQQQREQLRLKNIKGLEKNYRHSVFYQTDLHNMADYYVQSGLEIPDPLSTDEQPFVRFRNHMLRSEIQRKKNENGATESAKAFEILQKSIIQSIPHKETPRLNVYSDQIVWARSPVRLDIAGGWTDTPPYCLQSGGRVVNLAVNLNGQPPLQVFVRLSQEPRIVIRSIDNGVSETLHSFDDLDVRDMEGSAFSIPRAALALAGFHPDYCGVRYGSLNEQLRKFGGGIDISLLAAVPKGSGLGTSSILAATILGGLSDFCDLSWDKQAIGHRSLVLEQMLTTGGGWQDQYGGILPGIKMLETTPGMQEQMGIRWLPDLLFSKNPGKQHWLLYYTGITRVAKNILSEIVRGMFLNEGNCLQVLETIKAHAAETYDAIQQCDIAQVGTMMKRSWELNKALDPGTTTDEISALIERIDELTYGYKLLGAGGGGYLLMCTKDEAAAARIRERLIENPLNNKARFVEMELNNKGLEVSRS
ncbi:MAG: bifunctional fucokinase/fucose-1-phosphate guanylyltransferase [Marinilabilia sp.]